MLLKLHRTQRVWKGLECFQVIRDSEENWTWSESILDGRSRWMRGTDPRKIQCGWAIEEVRWAWWRNTGLRNLLKIEASRKYGILPYFNNGWLCWVSCMGRQNDHFLNKWRTDSTAEFVLHSHNSEISVLLIIPKCTWDRKQSTRFPLSLKNI